MSYYEQTDTDSTLPSYTINDANKVLTVDNNGLFLQWLQQTSELPIQTGNANKLLTTNGTAPSWTNNITATTTTFNIGSTTGNGANLITLNQNGASNFNVYTTDYSSIILPLTGTNVTNTSQYFIGMDTNESTGVFVMSATTSSGIKVYVSGASNTANYLTSFTTFGDATFAIGNIRSVVFGSNRWVVLGHNVGLQQIYYTTDTAALTGWTRVANTAPWSTSRTPNKLKFINNQFIVLFGSSIIRVSADAITWTELTINATGYGLIDIEYIPELRRYVIGLNTAGFLYYDNTTIPTGGATFTFVSVTNGNSNTLAWSSKLGLLLSQNNGGLINYSKDGANWAQYTASGAWNLVNMIWINDFGGFFVSTIFQGTNNMAFSRDGFTWTLLNNGSSNQGIRMYYNKTAKILFNGTGNTCYFKLLSTLLSTYIDPDAIYNTYNSNLRLKDNIEYEPQVIITATGNTHFTTQFFNRSVISFNTTNANANIYLQGISFNGRIGTKFKIVKTVSVNYGVRIHPYEACRIVTPPASMLNYNITNSIYDLIPQNYYGSFELTRVNDETDGIYTGTWLVDNVNVYPLLGGNVNIGDFKVIKASDGSDIINISATENVLGGYTRIANISGTLGQLELRNNGNAYKFSSPSIITKSSSNTYQWKINLDADNRVLNFIDTNSDVFELQQSLVKSYKNVELYQSNLITAPRVITNVSIPTINSSPAYYIHLNNNASYEPVLTWGNALTYPIGTVWEVLVNQYVNNLSQRAYFKMGTSMWWSYVNGAQNFKTTNDFYAELNALYKIIVLDWDITAGNTGTFQIIRIG